MPSDQSTTQSSGTGQDSQGLSPELVRKVTERVYQLLKEEARIEYERFRPVGNHRRFNQGGR